MPDVKVIPIACVPEVPKALQPMVRRRLKRESPVVPVWLDFEALQSSRSISSMKILVRAATALWRSARKQRNPAGCQNGVAGLPACAVERRVDERRLDSPSGKGIDLIFHQGDQRRNHDRQRRPRKPEWLRCRRSVSRGVIKGGNRSGG